MTNKLRLISRGGRVAASRIRRRPYLAGSVAFAAMLMGAGGLVSGLGEASSATAATTASSADLDAETMDNLLDARSPGGRGYGWLTNTKNPRAARAVRTPTERVLSSVRPRIPVGDVPDDTPSFGTVVPADGAPAGSADPVVLGGLPVGTVGSVVPVGPSGSAPGGVLPGGNGGGGTGGGDSTPGNPTNPTNPTDPGNPAVPAVPEPATWAMLLLGFAMLGGVMRRRHTYLLHGAR